jgi:hypothetical protein
MKLAGTAEVAARMRRVTRTKGYGDFRNWFTEEDIPCFQRLFGDFVQHFRCYDDWALNPVKIIRPRHSSEYVLKLVNEARDGLGLPWITVRPRRTFHRIMWTWRRIQARLGGVGEGAGRDAAVLTSRVSGKTPA